jgi:hypothetical protein
MIEELAPLVERAEKLRDVPSARSIYSYIEGELKRATTPSMAQAACKNVAARCHVKAWGDMNVEFGEGNAWWNYLSELRRAADGCTRAISSRYF